MEAPQEKRTKSFPDGEPRTLEIKVPSRGIRGELRLRDPLAREEPPTPRHPQLEKECR